MIDTKPLHLSYKVVKPFGEYEDGKYAEFSVDVELNKEFIGRVLQMGAGLEVMSPLEVREVFTERVKNWLHSTYNQDKSNSEWFQTGRNQ